MMSQTGKLPLTSYESHTPGNFKSDRSVKYKQAPNTRAPNNSATGGVFNNVNSKKTIVGATPLHLYLVSVHQMAPPQTEVADI